MTVAKYRCNDHGVFEVSREDLGIRGHVGMAPTTQPCPLCGEACRRSHQPKFSINGDVYARVKAYCQQRRISIGKFIDEITKDLK